MTLVIILYRYEQYVVEKNFMVFSHIPCDTATQSCFQVDCDSAEDSTCDAFAYKKITLPAREASACIYEHTCDDFRCDSTSARCSITLCSEGVLESGERCTAQNSISDKENI